MGSIGVPSWPSWGRSPSARRVRGKYAAALLSTLGDRAVYTIVITNANWSSTLTVSYTPDGAAPNASWIYGSTGPVTFTATDVLNAVSQALDAALGIPTCS